MWRGKRRERERDKEVEGFYIYTCGSLNFARKNFVGLGLVFLVIIYTRRF